MILLTPSALSQLLVPCVHFHVSILLAIVQTRLADALPRTPRDMLYPCHPQNYYGLIAWSIVYYPPATPTGLCMYGSSSVSILLGAGSWELGEKNPLL